MITDCNSISTPACMTLVCFVYHHFFALECENDFFNANCWYELWRSIFASSFKFVNYFFIENIILYYRYRFLCMSELSLSLYCFYDIFYMIDFHYRTQFLIKSQLDKQIFEYVCIYLWSRIYRLTIHLTTISYKVSLF